MSQLQRSTKSPPTTDAQTPTNCIAIPARRVGDPAVQRLVSEAVALGLAVEVTEDAS